MRGCLMTSAVLLVAILLAGTIGLAWWLHRKRRRDRELVYHELYRDSHGTPQRWRGSPAKISEYEELNRIWELPPSETND